MAGCSLMQTCLKCIRLECIRLNVPLLLNGDTTVALVDALLILQRAISYTVAMCLNDTATSLIKLADRVIRDRRQCHRNIAAKCFKAILALVRRLSLGSTPVKLYLVELRMKLGQKHDHMALLLQMLLQQAFLRQKVRLSSHKFDSAARTVASMYVTRLAV